VTEQEVQQVLDHVRALKDVIPGILSVDTGDNLSAAHQGYTCGFIMRFLNQEDLYVYASHDAHQLVSHELQRLCESIIDFDLEVVP
jgi:hypothetical protein